MPSDAQERDEDGDLVQDDATPLAKQYRKYFTCPKCSHAWVDVDTDLSAGPCPKCGLRHCAPTSHEEIADG